MAKKQASIFIPVENCAYLQPFTIESDQKHTTWVLCDFSEQSITEEGELCRDKPLKIRSNTGVTRKLEWGTLVQPIEQPKQEESQE